MLKSNRFHDYCDCNNSFQNFYVCCNIEAIEIFLLLPMQQLKLESFGYVINASDERKSRAQHILTKKDSKIAVQPYRFLVILVGPHRSLLNQNC